MLVIEKIIGNTERNKITKNVDYVDFDWHEIHKKIHRKVSRMGKEIGIRFDDKILKVGLKDGDILYENDDEILLANILETAMIEITINEKHSEIVAKVCYEIGNRHAPLFLGNTYLEYSTIYNEPMKKLLEGIHGVSLDVKDCKIEFSKSVAATIHSHTH